MPDSDDIPSGQRVVLGKRQNAMVKFKWSGQEPSGLESVSDAEELGAQWEGDELVIYDYPGFVGLLEYYEKGEYLSDND